MTKKIRKYKNLKTLNSALINNAQSNDLESLKSNLLDIELFVFDTKEWKLKNLSNLLFMSLKHCSKETSIFLVDELLSLGIDPYNKVNNTDLKWELYILTSDNIILNCDYNNIYNVYKLLDDLGFIETIFSNEKSIKSTIITRLISPLKMYDNPNRLNYLMELVKIGFISNDLLKECIKRVYERTKNNNIKRNILTSLIRDIKLSEIGI